MTKRCLWVAVVAFAVLAVGVLIASNMAFKLNVALQGPAPGTSLTGTNLIALPFNQQVDLITAGDLLGDIGVNAVNIQKLVRSADAIMTYDGVTGQDFLLTQGDAYFVQVSTDLAYVVLGTHDPGLTIALVGPQVNASLPGGLSSGTNPYAFPYHSVPTNADELLNEISACPGSVDLVSRFVRSCDAFAVYSCIGGDNFTLAPAQGYLIQVNTDVSYVPSHY